MHNKLILKSYASFLSRTLLGDALGLVDYMDGSAILYFCKPLGYSGTTQGKRISIGYSKEKVCGEISKEEYEERRKTLENK